MKAFKFVVPPRAFRPLKSEPDVCFAGCVAVAVATTEEEARAAIRTAAAPDGVDVRWLEVADVIVLPVDATQVLTIVMF